MDRLNLVYPLVPGLLACEHHRPTRHCSSPRGPERPCAAPTVLALPRRRPRTLHRVVFLHCLRGTVWLTHDGDRRDILLRPGERFLAPPGIHLRVLVEGLDDDTACAVVQAPRPGWLHRLLRG